MACLLLGQAVMTRKWRYQLWPWWGAGAAGAVAILISNNLKHIYRQTHIYTFKKASLHTYFSSNSSIIFLIPSERSEFFSNPLVMLRKVSCDAAKRHCLAFDIRGKTLTARFPRFDLFAKEKIRNAPDHHFQNTSHNDIYLQVNLLWLEVFLLAHYWCFRFYSRSGDFVTIYQNWDKIFQLYPWVDRRKWVC